MLFFQTAAFAQQNIQISDNFSHTLAAPQVYFYVDESNTLTLKEVSKDTFISQFQPLTNENINQGISTKSYWLQFTLKNPTLSDIKWVVFHETSYLDLLTVYVKEGNSQWQGTSSSDHLPFDNRSTLYRKLNFAHTTNAAGETQVFVNLKMLQPDTTTLALQISDWGSFEKLAMNEQWYYGHYFGACLSIIILSLIIWFKTRTQYALNYILYLITHMMMWAFFTGYIFQYALADDPEIYNMGFHIAYLLFYIAAVQFSKTFLNTALHLPKITRWINISQIVAVLAILLRLGGVYEPVLYISFFFLCLLLVQPILGLLCLKKGDSSVKWFTIAWSVFAFGLFLSVLSASTTLFSWGMDPILFTQLAGLLESILLALALAEKISQTQDQLFRVMEESQRDALTELGNRRMLDYYVSEFKSQQGRHQNKPRWLLLLDIDNFKDINDKHGHIVGDEILKQTARSIVKSCRSSDISIRYGGEEFLIILDDADQDTMKHIANRVKKVIANNTVKSKGECVGITISIGVSQLKYHQLKSINRVIDKADQALYQVKNNGKNKIAFKLNDEYQMFD